MFENLIAALKADKRKIVFTEGPDARILEAAARLKKDGLMDSVEITVTKFPHSEESKIDGAGDLIVELRSMEDGFPKEKLASVTVPADEIVSKEAKTVKLSYYLEKGKQYAVAMIMDGPLSAHGGFDCYGWATSGEQSAVAGEHFGKTDTTQDQNYDGGADGDTWNWKYEDNLGTGWLKINYLSSAMTAVSVGLSADKGILAIGENAQLTAEVLNKFGEVIENAPVAFTSSDDAIATVDETGKVTAVSGGVATITATMAGGYTQECIVRCTWTGASSGGSGSAAATLTPSHSDVTLYKAGESFRFRVSGTDSTPVWSTSNSGVASVDGSGTVTAVSKGTCNVTATVDGQTFTCIVRCNF